MNRIIHVFMWFFLFGINPKSYSQEFILINLIEKTKIDIEVELNVREIPFKDFQSSDGQTMIYPEFKKAGVISFINTILILDSNSVCRTLRFNGNLQYKRKVIDYFGLDTDLYSPSTNIIAYSNKYYQYEYLEKGLHFELIITKSQGLPEKFKQSQIHVISREELNEYKQYISKPDKSMLPRGKKIHQWTYGSWFSIIAKDSSTGIMVVKDGEFIGMENGRVVLLNNQQIIKIRSDQVKLAAVYTHNSSNPGKFTLITLISFLPNLIGAIAYPEYAGPFLRIGIFPLLLPGLIITLAESAKELSVKYYPVDIKYESDLIKYARFPQGIPADFISGFTSRNSQ